MPNPFPGMDPYLEGPFWTSIHHNLIEEIARQLSAKLRPKYFAITEARVTIATPDPIEQFDLQRRNPDVYIVPSGKGGIVSGTATSGNSIMLQTLLPEEREQTFVEIRDAKSRTLVTAIEVLSPTNKRGDGLEEFRKKRLELLASSTHYLEIDLLRIGERYPVMGPLPSVPYFVFLSRVSQRPRVQTWPIPLAEALPVVDVPLLPEEAEATLDLQSAWSTIYELFGYDQVVDHRLPPVVPLSPDQMTWATDCLQRSGVLS
jgi:Protein of unknown function (DUF4058)